MSINVSRTHRAVPFVLLVAAILTISLFARGARAHDDVPLTITASADGITLPEGLVSGITTLTIQNDTETEFQPTIAHFVEGATMEEFTAAIMAQDFAGMLETISLLGSPIIKPGEAAEITYDLIAGDYLLLVFTQMAPPTIMPFTVAENDGEAAEAPETDVLISMVDFAFGIPTELTTDDVLWQFSNEGEQTHEMVVFSVDEDATVEDVTSAVMEAMMATTPGSAPEIPYERAFSFVGISPGENAWMDVSLPVGTYAALCFIPDLTSEDMTPHLLHGMISIFTVSEPLP